MLSAKCTYFLKLNNMYLRKFLFIISCRKIDEMSIYKFVHEQALNKLDVSEEIEQTEDVAPLK